MLRQRIVNGERFEEIAKKWSINDNTAPRGGDRGRFTNRFEVDPMFQEDLFALEVDELSEPIPTASGLWALIKITDETLTSPDPETLRRAGGELQRRKFNKQRLALANKLARDYKLTLNEQGLSAFVARTSSAAPGLRKSTRAWKMSPSQMHSPDTLPAMGSPSESVSKVR